jgi:sirohydrochlorin cobaltochelatase
MTAEKDPMPVVLVASGTATKAFDTYRRIEAECRHRFPDHSFHLAFSSRAIRRQARQAEGPQMATPEAVLDRLVRSGHRNAVVQSLHLICGLEFHQMVWQAAQSDLEIHLGLPLLAHPDDFETVLDWIADVHPPNDEDGLVLVGHGTAHPAWMTYALLDRMITARFGERVFMGQVKGDPTPSMVAARLMSTGCRRVHLRPFMLVAGAHFMKDVAGDRPNSWQTQLERRGLTVIPKEEGLGTHPAVIALFGRHIEAAMGASPLKLD